MSKLRANDIVFVAGHSGMVGSAILRQLKKIGCKNIITKNRSELNLINQQSVHKFFSSNKIDIVILAAAKVGGIHANKEYPANFIYENLMIEANIIHEAWRSKVGKLLFLGSSCIYPKLAPQPMDEDVLLSGKLEETNEPYAIAKIAGIKMCESYNSQYQTDFRSVMPTNLYGENDNFHPENSHVIPAMLQRFHQAVQSGASEVIVWGTGKPRREFLHVDDLAEACLHVIQLSKRTYSDQTKPLLSHFNIGSGVDCTIKELAEHMACVVGFKGDIVFDTTKPDGTPQKLMDVSLLKSVGWEASISLRDGLVSTYQWYLENHHLANK